jgi:haloacetate dehalogenase
MPTATDPLFPGFRSITATGADGVQIHGVTGGSGPPLLLLHGYPQTHAIWHRAATRLAERFTIVATDLRGYGDSGKPPTDEQHAPYSKRAMASDQVAVMRALGHESFFLCGHDRGGRVAHRLAVDHPGTVRKLAVLDIAPTREMYAATDSEFARSYYWWFFLIQPADLPERLIGADPKFWLERKMAGKASNTKGLGLFDPAAFAEYLRCFTPETIHATCEDYRAAATIDIAHDDADGDNKLTQPLLALWGANGTVARCFDVLELWRRRAVEVRGEALPSGHYIPEECPDLLVDKLLAFFR